MRVVFLQILLLSSGCGHADQFLIEPAPEIARPAGAPEASLIYLLPFRDARGNREIFKARERYNDLSIDTAGRTSLAKSWSPKHGDLSFLWHRQLAFQLDSLGFKVSAAAEPLADAEALSRAAEAGAGWILDGEIKRLNFIRRGHDILGTNFTGTDYTFLSRAEIRLRGLPSGEVKLAKGLEFRRNFYNPVRLGAPDRDTFPHYFTRALPEAAAQIGADPGLRGLAGLPTLTATPTATPTPETAPPTPGHAPVIEPTPTPADEPYWACPKDGKKMDPAWEICPFDGTKRKDFILKVK